MAKFLLEQLPEIDTEIDTEIVANGRKEAERILESIEGRHRVNLQTRERVLPASGRGARGERARAKQQAFRLTPLFTVLLLAYPALQARYALAEPTPANTPQPNTPQPDTLPELGRPSDSPAALTPKSNGITLDNRSDGKRLVVSPEYSDHPHRQCRGIGGVYQSNGPYAGSSSGDRSGRRMVRG